MFGASACLQEFGMPPGQLTSTGRRCAQPLERDPHDGRGTPIMLSTVWKFMHGASRQAGHWGTTTAGCCQPVSAGPGGFLRLGGSTCLSLYPHIRSGIDFGGKRLSLGGLRQRWCPHWGSIDSWAGLLLILGR